MLVWLDSDTRLPDPEGYLEWLERALDAGKKLVVLGPLGVEIGTGGAALPRERVNRVWKRIGVVDTGEWEPRPLDATYRYSTPEMFLEREPFRWLRPPYGRMRAERSASVHLATERGALVVTSDRGAYAADPYLYRSDPRGEEQIPQWLIDPFLFFRLAYATDDLPKPDTTTLAGRRIYYSHIDGDGWNNLTRIEQYRGTRTLSAQVILEHVVRPHPDLPVTLTLIAADVDPDWAATEESRAVARAFLAEPHVEAGSHTYSHPFSWGFFQSGDWRRELPYLQRYPGARWSPAVHLGSAGGDSPGGATDPGPVAGLYEVPRAYARHPFELHHEIAGSLRAVAELLPPGKRVELLSWSGDCSPWEEAVRLTRRAGVANINGGDSRLDAEYPGYASLKAIGRQVGAERQIYASVSNENTYTDLWTANFHAYRYLVTTLERSGTPRRLKPVNVYYHAYSGERRAALNALLESIDYARRKQLTPITASHFARIAQGFFSTRLTLLDPERWRVDDRGALQTLRFDHSTFRVVDFARSSGVVGQRHAQGSLYVYVDAAVEHPVIALQDTDEYSRPPRERASYLVESRWLVKELERKGPAVTFTAMGFGAGEMTWQMGAPGTYVVRMNGEHQEQLGSEDGTLRFSLPARHGVPVSVEILQASDGDGDA